MAKLRVPQATPSSEETSTSRPNSGSAANGTGQAAFTTGARGARSTPAPLDPGSSSEPMFPMAARGSLDLPRVQGKESSVAPEMQSAPLTSAITNVMPVSVEPEVDSEPAPAPPLEPFTITPRPDLAISPEDEFADGPLDRSTAQIVWADAKFLSRAALPYVIVLSLLACGFLFREHIQELLEKADRRMRSIASSDNEQTETGLGELEDMTQQALPDGAASQLDEDGVESPATDQPRVEDPESIVRRRVIETNVQIARTSSQHSGSGVIFRITKDNKAIVLTNRSVVDSLYNIGINNSDPTIPDVTLTFADKSTATGKVTWVGGDGLDIALVETTDYPADILPANCDGAPPVGEGETLMFADIGATWDVGYASVRKFSSMDKATVFEFAPEAQASVGSGTALYNIKGDLIAIAGGRFPEAVSSQGSFAMMLKELKLPAR